MVSEYEATWTEIVNGTPDKSYNLLVCITRGTGMYILCSTNKYIGTVTNTEG